MELKIEQLKRDTISTKYGPKQKLSIQSNGIWYGCWSAAWNNPFSQGDTINVEVIDKHVNGKVYKEITGLSNGAVVKSHLTSNGGSSESIKLLSSINENLLKIISYIETNNVQSLQKNIPGITKVDQDEIPF